MMSETTLMEVTQPKKEPRWGDCKICGIGFCDEPVAKGLCHECRREKAFLRPVLESLQNIENILRKQYE
jgi:hypothetical protein